MKKNKQEILVGALGGLIFSIVAWGYDAVLLTKANAAYPWLKFLIGIIPCTLIGATAGWLTMKISNLFLRMLLWISIAILFGFMSSYIPFTATPKIIGWLNPEIGARINFNAPEAISARRFVTMVMTIFFLFIAGLMFENTNESIRASQGIVGAAFSLIFLMAFFGGAGYIVDSNFNADLRAPIVALNDKLDYVASVDTATLNDIETRALKRYTKLEVDFNGPRRLIMTSFDSYFTQVTVMVDFNGTLAECSIINSSPSSCKMLDQVN
ncbi:MAG: hypothetical protein GYA52_09825 [Chloroflexi bacterium]|nr:hypothetical protein [Chloroflexota bacterium]